VGIEQVKRVLLDFYQQPVQPGQANHGKSFAQAREQLVRQGVPAQVVIEAQELLVTDGNVHATIDDDHFAAIA